MKKRNVKSLKLNKTSITNFKGGNAVQTNHECYTYPCTAPGACGPMSITCQTNPGDLIDCASMHCHSFICMSVNIVCIDMQ